MFSYSRTLVLGFISLFLLCIATVSEAHNKVVVIPMSGDDLKPLNNIITVAKENGDFSDPIAAMNSITDASYSNPYLIVIAPGHYNISSRLNIKHYVNVVGSGHKTTFIKGSRSAPTNLISSGALIILNDNTSIEGLSIINNGSPRPGERAIGIYNNSDAGYSKISNVFLSVQSFNVNGTPAQERIGISNYGGKKLNLTNSFIEIFSFDSLGSSGIFHTGASAKVTNSSIKIFKFNGGGANAYAYRSNNSAILPATISNTILTGGRYGGYPICSFVFTDTGVGLNTNCN